MIQFSISTRLAAASLRANFETGYLFVGKIHLVQVDVYVKGVNFAIYIFMCGLVTIVT